MIYSKLEPNSIVKHDDKIYGHITERNRQIDVSIRTNIGGHEILVIVDAKDKSRAPTVETIGKLAEIMRDVSAHKGVIICRKKPSDKNIKYATKRGIDICTAIDTNDHKWTEHIKIPLVVNFEEYQIDLDEMHVTVNSPKLHIDHLNKWLISEDNGKTFKFIREFVLDFILKKNLISGNFIFKPKKQLYICHGQEVGKELIWCKISFIIAVKIHKKKLFRFASPREYQALRNHSNGKEGIAKIQFAIPHFSNESQWIDFSDIKIDTFESFAFANMILGEFGMFASQIHLPEIIHQDFRYLEKVKK